MPSLDDSDQAHHPIVFSFHFIGRRDDCFRLFFLLLPPIVNSYGGAVRAFTILSFHSNTKDSMYHSQSKTIESYLRCHTLRAWDTRRRRHTSYLELTLDCVFFFFSPLH